MRNSNITNLNDFQHFHNVRWLDNAFSYCTKLTDVKFWEGIEQLGDNTIAFCQKIRYIEFPSTIKHLGQMFLRYSIKKNNGIVICRALTPPDIHPYSVDIDAIALYVPDESVTLYKANENMTKFISKNILPLSKYQG